MLLSSALALLLLAPAFAQDAKDVTIVLGEDIDLVEPCMATRSNNGVPVDTTLHLLGRSSLFPNVVEVIEAMQQMLQDVGFIVEVQMLEAGQIEPIWNKPYTEGRRRRCSRCSTTTAAATRCSPCSSSTRARAGNRAFPTRTSTT